jgi:hypothetical protein
MVRFLLDCKADMNARDDIGHTPLWHSLNISDNDGKTTGLLCESKADILSIPNADSVLHGEIIVHGDSILHRVALIFKFSMASRKGHVERQRLEALLRHGAAVLLDVRDNGGQRPQDIAPDLFRNVVQKYGKPPL